MPTRGKQLTYTCQGCHGITGYKNAYPSYHVPKIGGQSAQYLLNALTEYKKGTRKHPTMQAQAQSFSDQDIADIAALPFDPEVSSRPHDEARSSPSPCSAAAVALAGCCQAATKPPPSSARPKPRTKPQSSSAGLPAGHIDAGEKLASTKNAKTGQSCVDCHGAEGNAPIDATYPKLAGQYHDYLAHSLQGYRDGKREHALMSSQASELTDQQIADLAAYFGSRTGNLRDLHGATTDPFRHQGLNEKGPHHAGHFVCRDKPGTLHFQNCAFASPCVRVRGDQPPGGGFTLPLSSCSAGLNGISGGGRASAG